MKKKPYTVEAYYPNPKGRKAADEAIDRLPMSATLTEAVDAWDQAYFDVAGHSPFRPKQF